MFWQLFIFSLKTLCIPSLSHASAGDVDPIYRSCVDRCKETGCVGAECFPHCMPSADGVSVDVPWHLQKSLYLKWKQLDCQYDCHYHCMFIRENERSSLGHVPLKYHGKWPFKRIYRLQEPLSVAFSVLNLAMHFHGWVSFIVLLHYKLPLKMNDKTYYGYTTLWHIYGLLSLNSWFWSSVFHFRDVEFTERLDYSSAVAVLGFSLIVAILRSFNVRTEATRVMVAAPLIAFVITHILYLNFYKMDYGWNMKVCVFMGVLQLLVWMVWAGVSNHPSRRKVWLVVVAGGLSMLLEVYDFPPYLGYADAHSLWHAATIPLTYLWWSFVKDDALFCTNQLVKKIN